jgi:hypothetical protein
VSENVAVVGDGIAAHACARLLRRGGIRVYFERGPARQSPVVLLSSATQHLLRDVFEVPLLFTGFHAIRRRIVKWGGSEAQTLVLPHVGVAVAESELLNRIGPAVVEGPCEAKEKPAWTVACSRTFPEIQRTHFGERTASASSVVLSPKCDAEACYVESVASGWLFLLPFNKTDATLLCVGTGAGAELLEDSRLVASQIAACERETSSFCAHPSILDRLARPGWIACGAAALTFDPLCGEGMGNSLREAILASAVVRASREGGAVDDLIQHYKSCLLGGFLRHLETCHAFYSSGPEGVWWQAQQRHTRQGIEWVKQRFKEQPFRFRLSGFELEEIASERAAAAAMRGLA